MELVKEISDKILKGEFYLSCERLNMFYFHIGSVLFLSVLAFAPGFYVFHTILVFFFL